MQNRPPQSFTAEYHQRTRVLLSRVWVSGLANLSNIRNLNPENAGAKEYTAIWDTGATSCAITERVVKECGLQPTGIAQVNTASGEHKTQTYLINVFLPNKFIIPSIKVTKADIHGSDVLIGMDIINKGDFAVTNTSGKTTMSFRMPSIECIDFVGKKPYLPTKSAKVGRNAPCPCGSGKKYKHCCGK